MAVWMLSKMDIRLGRRRHTILLQGHPLDPQLPPTSHLEVPFGPSRNPRCVDYGLALIFTW
jgi:hypothetical protein